MPWKDHIQQLKSRARINHSKINCVFHYTRPEFHTEATISQWTTQACLDTAYLVLLNIGDAICTGFLYLVLKGIWYIYEWLNWLEKCNNDDGFTLHSRPSVSIVIPNCLTKSSSPIFKFFDLSADMFFSWMVCLIELNWTNKYQKWKLKKMKTLMHLIRFTDFSGFCLVGTGLPLTPFNFLGVCI